MNRLRIFRATRLAFVLISAAALSTIGPVASGAQCFSVFGSTLPVSFSTRGLAMGDANVASSDADVIFYGPAQLAVARGVAGAVEHYDRYNLGSISAVEHVGRAGFGVGATYAGAPDLPCGTDVPPYVLPDVSGHRIIVTAGTAMAFGPVSLGTAVKFAESQYGTRAVSRMAADIGLSSTFRTPLASTSLSLAVQNIGSREKDFGTHTPLRFVMGTWTSVPAGPFDFAVAGQLAYRRYHFSEHSHRDFLPAVGLEVARALGGTSKFAFRGGFRRANEVEGNGNWTGGAGLTVHHVAIDYAVEALDLYRTNPGHRIGIRVGVP